MPLKHRYHRCPEVKEIDIPAGRIVGWTILAALWWRITTNVMDTIEFLIEKLMDKWIP